MRRAVRWGDNDRYFGPFTWSISSYKPWAVVLKSRGDDDCDCESGTCYLRISLRSLTLLVALPNIIKPHMKKVYPGWDATTINRLGRDWYWDIDPREYGFSCNEGHFNLYYGRTGGSTGDSSIEQRWSCFLPWTQWRHVRHSFYGLRGEHLYDEIQRSSSDRLDGEDWQERWDARQARENAVPTVTFAFKDFDGEQLTVTTKIEEREWRFGTGYFGWLSIFRRPKIRRSLNLAFSSETGRRKGSWKGGTVGHAIEMRPAELHEAAFRRYCAEHEMSFLGVQA